MVHRAKNIIQKLVEFVLVKPKLKSVIRIIQNNPPASKVSRVVENFDWRKKHTPTRILCQKFVCLSVCLSVTKFNPNYLPRLAPFAGGMKFATQISPLLNLC